MPCCDDEEHSPSEFYCMEKQITQMLRFKVKTTPNKTTVRKMLQALFLQHFNGFILHGTFVVCKKFTLYFRRLIFFLWSIVIVLLLQQVHCQKPPVYIRLKDAATKVFFVFFCKVRTNCDPTKPRTKPYSKSLINLVCSVCTGKYCLRFLSHSTKTSGNTFPYRPRTRLISP